MRLWPLLIAVLVAGCARPGTTPPADPAPTWTTYQADVTAVHTTADPQQVLLDVAPAHSCARNLQIAYYTEENNAIYANVVHDLNDGPCPTQPPATATLRSPTPIGTRTLILNQQAWTLDAGTYHRCDDQLGCHPPADHCDEVWIRAAVGGLDVSRHSQGTVEACDGTWLIMTVPDDPVACGAEPRAGCTPRTTIRRYFLTFRPAGWLMLTVTTAAGCGAVHDTAPSFPTKLCATLSAPS